MDQQISEADDLAVLADFFRKGRIQLVQLRQGFTNEFKASLNRPTQLFVRAIISQRAVAREGGNSIRGFSHVLKKLSRLRQHKPYDGNRRQLGETKDW